MRLALWTPAPEAPWVRWLETELAPALERVAAESAVPPAVELDLYHVASPAEHGFVYRALLRRPGVVLLAEWNLHALVHAETAGRGDAAAYLREARHAHGDTGVFVARQVLAGRGGELPRLVAMNQRVLEHGLAVVAFTEDLAARTAAQLRAPSVVHLPLDRLGAGATDADARRALGRLRDLLEGLASQAEQQRRSIVARVRAQASPAGLARDELAWSARELGLAEPPADAEAHAASLFVARP